LFALIMFFTFLEIYYIKTINFLILFYRKV